MVKCACCGAKLSSSAQGDLGELCANCQTALETGNDSLSAPRTSVIKPASARFTTTKLLYLLNLAVFAAMGFPIHSPAHHQLIEWGASWGPLTLGGQWWRMLTAIFVHSGLSHLLGNLVILWLIGKTAERILGRWSFAFVYLLAGIAGEALTLAVSPEALTCGASGALFGAMGALIAALLRKHIAESVSWPKTRLLLLAAMAAFSIYADANDRQVNNAAHLGGLATGLCLGVLLTQKSAEHGRLQKRVLVGATAFLTLATLFIRYKNGYVVPLGYAIQAVADNKLDDAQRLAELVLRGHPADVEANVFLGNIYIQKEDYLRAEPLLLRAVSADPDNASALYLLGVVYLRTGRVQSALDITTKLLKLRAVGTKEWGLFADAVKAKGEFDLAGDQYLSLQRYDDAIQAFQTALKKNPNDTRSKQGLIQAYRATGMNAEADALEKSSSLGTGRDQPPH